MRELLRRRGPQRVGSSIVRIGKVKLGHTPIPPEQTLLRSASRDLQALFLSRRQDESSIPKAKYLESSKMTLNANETARSTKISGWRKTECCVNDKPSPRPGDSPGKQGGGLGVVSTSWETQTLKATYNAIKNPMQKRPKASKKATNTITHPIES